MARAVGPGVRYPPNIVDRNSKPPFEGRLAADATEDLRALLRRRTADAHRSLDTAPGQRVVLRPDLTDDAYASFLAGQLTAHRACEAELARCGWAVPDGIPTYRSRLPALRSDLAGLSVARSREPEVLGRDAERASGHGVRTSEGALGRYLGLRYVLDGATQGAKIIAPRLARHRPDLMRGRWAYWRLLEQAGSSWPALTGYLAARPASGPLADAAVAGAIDAFDAFLNVFVPTSDPAVVPASRRTP